ncbi:hypothetical protein [Undibacterium sp.]|uniref:hypothetical protein n=1 Tax=Undibacterium sp. TaxID=1914977 RepID=UPI0037500FF0
MKISQLLLFVLRFVVALNISTAVPSLVLADQHSEHKRDAEIRTQLNLNDGKKWRTDDALRHAMTNIRISVTNTLTAIHSGNLKSTQYDVLTKSIEKEIAFIVANCKLDPKADENLHIILGRFAIGVDIVTAKRGNQEKELGVINMAETLNIYGKYFDHPGWRTIELNSN